jgi:hypothetical protein
MLKSITVYESICNILTFFMIFRKIDQSFCNLKVNNLGPLIEIEQFTVNFLKCINRWIDFFFTLRKESN